MTSLERMSPAPRQLQWCHSVSQTRSILEHSSCVLIQTVELLSFTYSASFPLHAHSFRLVGQRPEKRLTFRRQRNDNSWKNVPCVASLTVMSSSVTDSQHSSVLWYQFEYIDLITQISISSLNLLHRCVSLCTDVLSYRDHSYSDKIMRSQMAFIVVNGYSEACLEWHFGLVQTVAL